jgi:hypothetical protein
MNTDKMSPDAKKQMNQVLSFMDSLTTPISLKSHIAPDGTSFGKFFIPMDYVKLIDLIGNLTNKPVPNGA